ncbi:MAG: hypothetical protein QM696_09900 [Steroidobacteraceae bacterium]
MNHRILICTAALLAGGPALSAELDYALRAGVALSDNVLRMPPDSQTSSTAAVVGVDVHGQRPVGRLRYDVAADLAYYDYLSPGGIGSQVYGRALLTGAYDFIPDTFSWNAGLNYDQISADMFRPLAPGNTEDVLTLSTGPTLRARFSNIMEGQLDGRYTRTSYEKRPFDNETAGGRAMLVRRANPRSMIAVGVSYDDVSYVSKLGPSGLDYNRHELFARTELHGVRTDVQVEAGYADVSGQSFSGGGLMLRARLSRRLTPALSAFLNGVREYPTSEAAALSADPTIAGGGTYDSGLLTSGPRLSSSYEGGLRFTTVRAQAELAYLRRKEESLLSAVGERNYDEVRARVARNFTPRMNGSLFAVYSSEDFTAFVDKYDERIFGAQLGITFGRAMGLELRAEHRKRDGIVRERGYSEMSGGVFLRYAPGAPRRFTP